MQAETLKIFDESGKQIGVATRDEVHKKGYWHETFHCWLVSIENDLPYIYFQKRSKTKKDFPDLLDITAAGHILAHETSHDGIREVNEELGIDVKFNDVQSLGVIKNSIVMENFIDNELSHIFLLKSNEPFTDFNLQKEEVSGIVKSNFKEFYEFAHGLRDTVEVQGFEIDEEGTKHSLQLSASTDHFVSHEHSFLVKVVELLKNNI